MTSAAYVTPVQRLAVLVGVAAVLAVARYATPEIRADLSADEVAPAAIERPARSRDPVEISFDPASGTTVTGPSLEVTITWCHATAIAGSTRIIKLNGQVVTGSFTYETGGLNPCFDLPVGAKSVGTVTLAEGVNTLIASICEQSHCPVVSVDGITRL